MAIRYHLTIEQIDTNGSYDAEYREWEKRNRDRYMMSGPSEPEPKCERSLKVLSVTVTEVEFAAIKKAALATMA